MNSNPYEQEIFDRTNKLLFLITDRMIDVSQTFSILCRGAKTCPYRNDPNRAHDGMAVLVPKDPHLDIVIWVGDEFFGITDRKETVPPAQSTVQELREFCDQLD